MRIPGETGRGEEGEVRFLDNAVDAATGTLRMKAVLPNRVESLTPGQFLEVSLVLETLQDAVTVSLEAVQQGPDGSFVYVLQPDQTAKPHPVKVLATRNGAAAVSGKIEVGDTVVTDGHSRLTPKSKVKIKDGKAEEDKAKQDKPAHR